ncbi:MAG: hypothetical protein JW852_11470 [Spirochaetales bacterium]|nr:hypothetical protein [Spirochaetales bacterium]
MFVAGVGGGFIPDVLDINLVDMVFTVSDTEATDTTRLLSQKEGLLVGTSSGANVFTAIHLDNGPTAPAPRVGPPRPPHASVLSL